MKTPTNTLRSKICHHAKTATVVAGLVLGFASNAVAGKFFLDSFDDGNASDGSPVTWFSNFGGGGSVDDEGYTFTPGAPSCCLGAVIADELYDNATVRTRIAPGDYFLAGINARGPVGGAGLEWYFAGIRRDRIVGLFSGPSLIGSFDLPPDFDFAQDDVNLQLDMNGNSMSLRAWLNDDPAPEEPQLTVETSPSQNFFSSEGRLGFWHNSLGSANPPLPASFRYFEVEEYLDRINVGGAGQIGLGVFEQRQNLALEGTATASSSRRNADAANAIDGLVTTAFRNDRNEHPHWWQVELDNPKVLHSVRLTNLRSNGAQLVDGGGFQLSVLDPAGNAVFQQDFVDFEYTEPFVVDLDADGPIEGSVVRLEKLDRSSGDVFALREVEVLSENFIALGNTLLNFEIDLDSGQHDVLTVPGTFDMKDSQLNVSLLSGTPQLGDNFQLIEAEKILGEFGEINLPMLNEPLAWNTSNLALDGTLSVITANCNPNTNGDIDGDGSVAFSDFLILSDNFGNSASSHAVGDIDCNSEVAFADFLLLSANFGATVSGVAAVPEPQQQPCLALALLLLGAIRSRRKKIASAGALGFDEMRKTLRDKHP